VSDGRERTLEKAKLWGLEYWLSEGRRDKVTLEEMKEKILGVLERLEAGFCPFVEGVELARQWTCPGCGRSRPGVNYLVPEGERRPIRCALSDLDVLP